MHDIVKHAHVRDEGVGCLKNGNLPSPPPRRTPGSICRSGSASAGLFNMRERVSFLNGQNAIDTSPGAGTASSPVSASRSDSGVMAVRLGVRRCNRKPWENADRGWILVPHMV